MAKQNLLLIDADLRSLRVLEVSLRKAGYNVASIGTAREALGMLEQSRPDLVLCDTRLPGMDGFELIQEIRKRPDLADIPLMILSSDVSVETKVRGLQLGVEDYLTKPIYIKELLARVGIVLQRKRREGIEQLEHGNKRRFSGALSDMGVVDLLQAVDHNKKSGVLYLKSAGSEAAIYFCNGAPVDAAVGSLHGTRAIYRTLLWTDGTFEIDFREIDREDHVQTGMQALLMEGLRRVDEWGRLLEQLPDMDTVFEVSETQLFSRLAEIPDQINSVLREFDGRRSLWQILDACDGDDLETLNAVSKLYFEGLLYNTGRHGNDPPPRPHELEPEPSDIVLPHISSGPPVITHTLAPAWPSVPTGDDSQPWTRVDDDTFQLNIPSTPRVPEEIPASLNAGPRRRKGRKRKRRGSTVALDAAAKENTREAEDAEVQEVDESVAELTPITVSPPAPANDTDEETGSSQPAKVASAPPPLPTTSKPLKPSAWPDEHITSEVSLSELTDASSDLSTLLDSDAEVLSELSTAAPAHTTPPPLPKVSTAPPAADPADFTLVPGAPVTHVTTARPPGLQTQPPLNAASSAPPGPTTMRPDSTTYRDTAEGLQPSARQSLHARSDASQPPLDAEDASDLSLQDAPPLAAERRSLAEPPPAISTPTEPALDERARQGLLSGSEPPLDAETAPDLSFTELPAVSASEQPPRLPVESVPLAQATEPPTSVKPTPSDIPVVTQSYSYEEVSSSLPVRATNGEGPSLPSLRVSSVPTDTREPLDFDSAAAKLGAPKKKKKSGVESLSPVVSIKPSLRHDGPQPVTTAKPPPFNVLPSMSQSPSPRAGHAPQHRTDVPPPFSLDAANDNASQPPAAEQIEPDTVTQERDGSELSAFAKIALAGNSTRPESAPASDTAEAAANEALSSSELLSAAVSASLRPAPAAQLDVVEPEALEAPTAQPTAEQEAPALPAVETVANTAPPKAASVPAPDKLSQMPTGETAAVVDPAPPKAASVPAPNTLSQMPTGETAAAVMPASIPASQDVWSTSKMPSQAAPAKKSRVRRWLQVGSVAAATALAAAGFYALRARDAVPQGSLIRAVPTGDVAVAAPQDKAPLEPPGSTQPVDDKGLPPVEPAKATAVVENAEPAQPSAVAPEPTPQPPAAEPSAANAEEVEEVKEAKEVAEAPQPSAATPPAATAEAAEPPKAAAATPATDTKDMLAKARKLEQKGRKKDALAQYEKIVAAGGGSSELQSHMAFMYLNQGNNAKAEEHALKASTADETNSEAWIVLGAARSSLGKKQAADEAYRNCAKKGQGQYVTECRRMLR